MRHSKLNLSVHECEQDCGDNRNAFDLHSFLSFSGKKDKWIRGFSLALIVEINNLFFFILFLFLSLVFSLFLSSLISVRGGVN